MVFAGEEISDEELYELIEEADRDGDGCLNFAEFYRIMKKREDPLDDFDSDLDWVRYAACLQKANIISMKLTRSTSIA